MEEFLNFLDNNLYLNGFKLLQITDNKILIFKSFSKYSKCIYIKLIDDSVEVKINKVFDVYGCYNGIERLIIPTNKFTNMNSSLKYIQKNCK
ncbi:hypothetical protein [Paraclostridium sordellii]|uniref:Uncharacterized protein n=1 Tax=Paraclostridium sordellii TaxID=1505 RepID=A0A0C7G904_PARSO|nr:hypothetical protein [Paeniclostridium sordellii]CEN78964.1 Uncharacterised protein [[Clostridium] sordellii] [Paeniclostridium sordellii]CEQ04060.1 Uncharacterised protein [[Clostridium] sordellii] [Paeniclostridium sordellii]